MKFITIVGARPKYLPHKVYYTNFYYNETIPRNINFDLVIFHTIFLYERYKMLAGNLSPHEESVYLKRMEAVKVAVPQDEFFHTDTLCAFINEFGVSHIFSVAPESEWRKIYRGIAPGKTAIHKVLTGYLDDDTLSRIKKYSDDMPARSTDICYRSYKGTPGMPRHWLGSHGTLKWRVAEVISERAIGLPLNLDISLREEDTLFDDDWIKFLLRSKYIVGVEGGASVLDHDGSVMARSKQYLSEHPDAPYEQVEAACFPGLDGNLNLMALSPRHLEACATKTCQLLVEGEYNGILKPWIHYIPIKRDFSNIDEVIRIAMADELRDKIVEQAYSDVVESGIGYGNFVESVVRTALGQHYTSLCSTHRKQSETEANVRQENTASPIENEKRQFLKALAENPSDSALWISLGRCAFLSGDIPLTETAFRSALSLEPGNNQIAGIVENLARINQQ